MDIIPEKSGSFSLLIAPRRISKYIATGLLARLALAGQIDVIDGGNCFDAYAVARAIRSQTSSLADMLKHIRVARAFTCYQVLALLSQSSANAVPKLVLDLLSTFYDDGVDIPEGHRLLRKSIIQINRLSHYAPLVVFARPPAGQPDRVSLFTILQDSTENKFTYQSPSNDSQQRLF